MPDFAMEKLWNIYLASHSETTKFAAAEFKRLMKKADTKASVTITENESEASLIIGLSDKLPTPKVCDPTLDDAISINVSGMKGYITASNERAVLMAVYRFFREAGAIAYVRPGRDGERVYPTDFSSVSVKLEESAAMRYRGFCFEGSAGYEHFVDLIDFAPKMGMNVIFTQLWRPTFAFNRWYGNEKSPAYVPAGIDEATEERLVAEYDKEIKRRGLNHHRMGHGWIPSVLGEKSGLWHGVSRPDLLREEDRPLVAEIGGERKLFNGSAIDTCFCYGNPEARRRIVCEVVEYAREHTDVDTLHFWLADQPNNQCECELCRDTLPSDFYVDMLNDLDDALTREGIKTRIVFLAYLELLWTPKRARIKNPDRFMLIFAPIRRPYERPLTAQFEGKIPKFERNKWVNSCQNFSVLNHLKDWQEQFPGECILFDYHLMWDSYNDITGEKTGKMLGLDMAELPKSKLLGNISCQGVRMGILGALPMRLMADALWSGKSAGEEEADAFYRDAYGEDCKACREIISRLLTVLDPDMLRGVTKMPKNYPDMAKEVKAAIKNFSPILAKHRDDEDFSLRVSYIYLSEMLRLADLLIDFLTAASLGDEDEGKRCWARVLSAIGEIEALYPKALDAFEFSLVWHRHVLPLFFPNWKIDYDSGELTM